MNTPRFSAVGRCCGCSLLLATLTFTVQAGEWTADRQQVPEETTVRTNAPASPRVPGIGHSSAGYRRTVVSFADLNLSRQPGLDTLYHRLQSAAEMVCSPRDGGRDASRGLDYRACYRSAMDRAVESVDNPGLRQTHLAYTGRRVGGADEEQQVAGR